MVLINRILPGYETRCVALDDRYGAWLATRHLIQQGHTRIGYLCSNHHISDAEDRLQGYYAALEESGLPCNDRLVAFAEPDESGGELAMTELLGRGRHFSAVACYNDSMAAGAMGVTQRQRHRRPAGNFADWFRRCPDFALCPSAADHCPLPDRHHGDPGGRAGLSPGGVPPGPGDHPPVQPDAGAPSLGGRPAGRR